MYRVSRHFASAVVVGLCIIPAIAVAESGDSRSEWPMFGQNEQNTASNDEERKISTSNVSRLAPKWVATTGGDVSARAAVVDGAVYFPDFGGNLWALDADTGAVIWQHQLSDYGLSAGTARAPARRCKATASISAHRRGPICSRLMQKPAISAGRHSSTPPRGRS